MSEWQFNVLFVVGVGGAAFMLIAPYTGLNVDPPPTAIGGIGSILAFILTQKRDWTRGGKNGVDGGDDE